MAKEPELIAEDGTIRKQHYGTGKQPWDTIKELGWAAVFAAGNALKYVRRFMNKNGEDDLEKGRWYYAELVKLAETDFPAAMIKRALLHELTEAEQLLLIKPS